MAAGRKAHRCSPSTGWETAATAIHREPWNKCKTVNPTYSLAPRARRSSFPPSSRVQNGSGNTPVTAPIQMNW